MTPTEGRGDRAIRLVGPVTGLAAQALLLVLLAATVGLGWSRWVVGATCGVIIDASLARSLFRDRSQRLGLASWLTLTRATLAVGVAALTADSFGGRISVTVLVSLATLALVLDFIDGQVARRTGTESRLGARFDGEIDAFLILVLSVYVAQAAGTWVLLIGAARYAFLAGEWLLPWMTAALPPRDWRKVVAAAQGIVLTIAAADVLPLVLSQAALAVALALLTESFCRDVWWLWRHRDACQRQVAAAAEGERGRVRAGLSVVLTLLAFVLVWVALAAPHEPNRLSPGAFARLPLEGFVVIALGLVLPIKGRHVLAWVVGPVLGVVLVVKLLDIGFFAAFDRPFNPVDDWSYASVGIETMRESVGRTKANLAVAGVVLVGAAALLLPTLAMLRLTRVAAGHRRLSLQALTALGGTWVLCWAFGGQIISGAPIASTSAADLAVREVQAVQAGIRDRAHFAGEIRQDRYRYTPGRRLLTGLRGKDVVLVFVESYGKFAVQGSSISPPIDRVLASGTRQLRAAGFSARSGWLTSPTFGGISWLAHSSMQSGVWVDTKQRYDQLISSDRFTLSQAFRRAGWRTAYVVPANNRDWPEGSTYYHFDQIYDRRNVGYRGPTYAYAPMPDQYVYLAMQRHELGKPNHRPLFAEVDTVSSHTPWTRIPPLIDWNAVGDGSVFNRLPVDEAGSSNATQGYAHSVQYSLRTLFSFVQRYGDDNLVMIVLGDHQAAHVVTGYGVSHDVPVSIIAHDPTVLDRVAGWGWTEGMRPGGAAPVWPMSAFRDRLLATFGSTQ
jgi:phosphatidylglycerophosphate synthase